MKNFSVTLLLILISFSNNFLQAQTLTPAQTKEILHSYQWMLRRYEKDGQMFTVPKSQQGMKMIFHRNNTAYYYLPSRPELPVNPLSFTITKDKLYFGKNVEDARFSYRFEKLIDYKIYMTNEDEDDPYTYVWEKAEPIKDDQYPGTRAVIINNNSKSYESTPADAYSLVKLIDKKVKEAIGNIRKFNNSKVKIIIDDASFETTETGVKLMVKLNENGSITTFTYEFMPEEIESITSVSMPKESPVGQLQMTLQSMTANIVVTEKKTVISNTYNDHVNLNFLKVDAGNYEQIKKYLLDLKEAYITGRMERLSTLEGFVTDKSSFWISGNGSSKTYQLDEAFVSGCTLRLFYNLQNISTRGDSNEDYLTVIPLGEVNDITLDKSKSKPNCILLQAGKKGFQTYKLEKDEKYVLTSPVNEIPLFIDVSTEKRRNRVVELLGTHIKECGGKKLSL